MNSTNEKSHKTIIKESTLFDSIFYFKNNPILKYLRVDSLEHCLQDGESQGLKPNPFFDPFWYKKCYKDIKGVSPLLHYVQLGEAEGVRPCSFFDPAWYLETNEDVKQAGGLNH